jgi:hypothetical protein
MVIVVVLLVVVAAASATAAGCLLRSPRAIQRLGQAEIDRHALRRSREFDELRFKVRRDRARLRAELLEEFHKEDT